MISGRKAIVLSSLFGGSVIAGRFANKENQFPFMIYAGLAHILHELISSKVLHQIA